MLESLRGDATPTTEMGSNSIQECSRALQVLKENNFDEISLFVRMGRIVDAKVEVGVNARKPPLGRPI